MSRRGFAVSRIKVVVRVFTESDMSWQPWRPRRRQVLACASSSHGPLEGGECLIKPPPGTSEFGQS